MQLAGCRTPCALIITFTHKLIGCSPSFIHPNVYIQKHTCYTDVIIGVYIYTHVHSLVTPFFKHPCATCICIYMHIYIRIHLRKHIYIYIYIYTYICVYMLSQFSFRLLQPLPLTRCALYPGTPAAGPRIGRRGAQSLPGDRYVLLFSAACYNPYQI